MIEISYRLPYLFHGEDKGTGGGFLQGGEGFFRIRHYCLYGRFPLFRRKYSRYALTQGLAHSFDMDRHVAGGGKQTRFSVYNVLFR